MTIQGFIGKASFLHNLMKNLPPQSGPFSVGCCDVINSYGEGRLLFRLFYPTTVNKNDNSYLTSWLGEPEYAYGYCDFLNIKFFTAPFRWLTSNVKVSAIWNESFQLPKNLSKLPVIIFSHGLGGNRLCYSKICSELTSNGILVAAVEHADKSACLTYYLDCIKENGKDKVTKKWIDYHHVKSNSPDEHIIRNNQVYFRAKECSKLLDCIFSINDGDFSFVDCGIDLSSFKHTINKEKCAIVGHSFGAATSITVLSNDDRFAVGVGLDAWMFPLDKSIYAKLQPVPFLFINSENFQWPANVADMRKLDADVLNVDVERHIVTLLGTVHQTQSDFPIIIGSNLLLKLFKLVGSTDPLVALNINNDLILKFIGKYLGMDVKGSIDDVIAENEKLIYKGTNVSVDKEKVIQSKLAVYEMHNSLKNNL